jgi:hypothetical protein
MAAGLSTVQHPDAGLLDSYVTNAGGNTGDLFDELTRPCHATIYKTPSY